jgi:RNA 3'-terminal phosphate cyclase
MTKSLSAIWREQPSALAGGGEFTTPPVSAHFQSHASIIETFLGRQVSAISK